MTQAMSSTAISTSATIRASPRMLVTLTPYSHCCLNRLRVSDFSHFTAPATNTRRHSEGNGSIGDVARDDRTGANHSTLSDPGARQDDCPDTQPGIVADNDRTFCLQRLVADGLLRRYPVIVGVKGTVWGNLDVRADLNRRQVSRKLTARLDMGSWPNLHAAATSGLDVGVAVQVDAIA